MALPLTGLTVLMPESREQDLFARMLEADGAAVLRCPLVAICDLEDDSEARDWIAQLIAGAYQDVILTTGEGLRRLLAIARQGGLHDDFIAALGKVRTVTRGPKPAQALRELGLTPVLPAVAPTSQGIVDVFRDNDIAGRSIGLQLYPGEGGLALARSLGARSAKVFVVTPYRYASDAETGQVLDAIKAAAEGRVELIAFTSTPQVERIFTVAHEAGLDGTLQLALQRARIAAVGPVVEDALKRRGVGDVLRPASSYHLRPLVRAIAADWASRQTEAQS